ncbi:MAG: hypothetical protein O6848_07130 [Bacteroidetes bacterium]|nr:hypothetical protein [Bacteroidota bacterium]
MENQNSDPPQKPQITPSHLSKEGKAYPHQFKKLMNHALDDVAFYQNLLETILAEFGNFKPQMETLIVENDLEGIRRFHHKLNTTIKLLEYNKLDGLFTDLKTMLQNKEVNHSQKGKLVIAELQNMLDEVGSEIKNLKSKT